VDFILLQEHYNRTQTKKIAVGIMYIGFSFIWTIFMTWLWSGLELCWKWMKHSWNI